MKSSELETHVRIFFDEFVEAFRSFDGNIIAERYLSPYLAFHTAESIQIFTSRAETATYFQGIVDQYHAEGCRACRYKDMSVMQLGNECAIGTVTWELLAEDRSVISAWRESYNLCRVEGRLMVFASTDHGV
ncbi:MAG: hypothetical protein QM766_06905 [Burkholderiaceae bacterium]